MRQWWQTIVADYFVFSKKERIAILIIISIAGLLWIGSHYLPINKPTTVGKETFQYELANLQIPIDSSHKFYGKKDLDQGEFTDSKRNYFNNYAKKDYAKGELFEFEPGATTAFARRAS